MTAPAASSARLGRWRLALGSAGAAATGYGLWGILTGGVATAAPDAARWLLGSVLGHDLLIAPLVAAAGWLVARTVPPTVRPIVASGLFVAGAVVLVALPVLTGRGGHGNATSNPLDYPRNVLLVLAVVAASTALLAGLRIARARTGARRPTVPDS